MNIRTRKTLMLLAVACLFFAARAMFFPVSAEGELDSSAKINKGYEILREAWLVKNQEMWWRVFTPAAMARYNPDLAVKVAQADDGAVPDEVVGQIIDVLAERDPKKVIVWAPAKLEKLTNSHIKVRGYAALAQLSVTSSPEQAAAFYKLAAENADKGSPKPRMINDSGDEMDYALLAGVARRLGKNDESKHWTEKLLAAAKKRGGDEQEVLVWLIDFVAAGSPDLAEELSLKLDKRRSIQGLADTVAVVSFYDKEKARNLFAKLSRMDDANIPGALSYGQAALYMMLAWGKDDPEGMLQIAKGIQDERYKPLALGLVSAYLPKAKAVSALQEAFDSVDPFGNHTLADWGWLAGQTFKIDPDAGAKLFTEAKKRMKTVRELRTEDVAAFAYYMRDYDPAGARLMLETELDRSSRLPQHSDWDKARVAGAMAAFDLDRALEIARSIQDKDGSNRSWALRGIAAAVMETPEQRERADYLHRFRGEMWSYGGPSPR